LLRCGHIVYLIMLISDFEILIFPILGLTYGMGISEAPYIDFITNCSGVHHNLAAERT